VNNANILQFLFLAIREGEYIMRRKKAMVVVLCALLLFGALAIADVSLGQQVALADEATFYSTASDGYLENTNDSYSVARNAVNAETVESSSSGLSIGQALGSGGNYLVQRSALFFDTSSLPDDTTIVAATLSLNGYADNSDTEFDITVVDGSLLNDPLVAGDYGDLLNQTTSGGVLNTLSFTTIGYNNIPLNAFGIGWISKTGMTKFGLRSSRDITNAEPFLVENVGVHAYEIGDGYRPRLVVTYYELPPPSPVPTLSQWGMIGMGLLLAAFLAWSVRRRWVVSGGNS
jgi:hypothetical protein